jgi:hypothetical protein
MLNITQCNACVYVICVCYQQFTPLIVAALQGQMSAADALLDEGHADVKARNSRGTAVLLRNQLCACRLLYALCVQASVRCIRATADAWLLQSIVTF